MLTNLSTGNCFRFLSTILLFALILNVRGQNDSVVDVKLDSLQNPILMDSSSILMPDSLLLPDSVLMKLDSIANDSINSDSIPPMQNSTLDGQVDYKATDSLRFDLRTRKVFLYKEDIINYGSINLQGDYMEIDFTKNEIYSRGIEDSTGNMIGEPIFKESDDEFASVEMKYNFDTKKGLISGVSTEESGGFLHGEKIKKMPDNTAYIQGGRFTTCELDHPHYAFRFRKSKVIPGDKIITGPAYFEIANVPTPLLVPFGLFPNQSGKQSGIIIPSYGESASQGFYFRDGGYYWAVSDYLDLEFLGSIYTRGSWALSTKASYKKKYKYTGNMNLKYAINIIGSEGSPDYNKSNDFLIQWNHSQDPKARPKSKFSANVNMRSSSYNQYELSNTYEDKVSSTFQSSVNYSTRFGESWNFNANMSHSQNTQTKIVSMTLPQITLSGTRFYPFRKKDKAGALKWYDNIYLTYSMDARNKISVADSLMFTPGWDQYFSNGMQHKIPISSSVKILKYLNWTNSINLTSRWYTEHINQSFEEIYMPILDTTLGQVNQDTINGFITATDFSLSSNVSTKLYGMYTFGKNSPVKAIRHVITPTVGFSYRPDFGESQWGYYDSYNNTLTEEVVDYSIFKTGTYGSPDSGKSGNLNFSLVNNIEMKVRDRNDTVTGDRKVVLIDNLTFTTSYNMAVDSLNWQPLRISGRTKLFKNIDIRYNSQWDPYILDSAGTHNLNQTEWSVNHRLYRMENMSWSTGLNLTLNNSTLKDGLFKKDEKTKSKDKKDGDVKAGTIPWSVNFSYNLSYNMIHNYLNYELVRDNKVTQTLGFTANLQLTPNWKMNFRSGYDFKNEQLTTTMIDIVRDLHCWEMRFNWTPFGQWKSWNFSINIKSSMFKDLKVEKKKSHLDY